MSSSTLLLNELNYQHTQFVNQLKEWNEKIDYRRYDPTEYLQLRETIPDSYIEYSKNWMKKAADFDNRSDLYKNLKSNLEDFYQEYDNYNRLHLRYMNIFKCDKQLKDFIDNIPINQKKVSYVSPADKKKGKYLIPTSELKKLVHLPKPFSTNVQNPYSYSSPKPKLQQQIQNDDDDEDDDGYLIPTSEFKKISDLPKPPPSTQILNQYYSSPKPKLQQQIQKDDDDEYLSPDIKQYLNENDTKKKEIVKKKMKTDSEKKEKKVLYKTKYHKLKKEYSELQQQVDEKDKEIKLLKNRLETAISANKKLLQICKTEREKSKASTEIIAKIQNLVNIPLFLPSNQNQNQNQDANPAIQNSPPQVQNPIEDSDNNSNNSLDDDDENNDEVKHDNEVESQSEFLRTKISIKSKNGASKSVFNKPDFVISSETSSNVNESDQSTSSDSSTSSDDQEESIHEFHPDSSQNEENDSDDEIENYKPQIYQKPNIISLNESTSPSKPHMSKFNGFFVEKSSSDDENPPRQFNDLISSPPKPKSPPKSEKEDAEEFRKLMAEDLDLDGIE